ncbi:DUF6509 family protein [Paenibacillus sp. CF384]|uniref:DUF6509 family protein n=1 Tax=Paenibacillus sp. CF384 TaxID=1884382 RepID=UPI00089630DF|nr:DUF6509 family protein [Paenibacillus sp. CF384]SDX51634.1 hypothetical protein SAMN05518855_1015142 [Paenibacillus sp. CF384]
MISITEFSVDKIKDPFGILAGDRYEFRLDVDLPEDDELFVENGVYIRVIYKVDGESSGIVKYELYERMNDRYVDAELEDEEEQLIDSFCKAHFSEAEE